MTRRAAGSRKQGAAMLVWLFFANLFDPAKATATEQVDTQRRIGVDHLGAGRAAAASPPPGPGGR